MQWSLFATLATLSFTMSCVPAPKQAYGADDIANITSLEEVMRVQAHKADPLFSIRDEETFDDAQFAAMSEASAMLLATSAHLKSFVGQGEYDDGFGDFAAQVNTQAEALAKAAESKDAAGASDALNKMKSACAGCHGVYK